RFIRSSLENITAPRLHNWFYFRKLFPAKVIAAGRADSRNGFLKGDVDRGPGQRDCPQPAKFAVGPSSSSTRRSWLYFASRSPRATEPILICPAAQATARSPMVLSSVSPL